jgi:1-acyl-sn-glycerol-3-phosphate acyltransferase
MINFFLQKILFFFNFILSTIFFPIILIFLKTITIFNNINFDWQLNSYIFIYYLCGIKHNIKAKKLIKEGYIISNHRSFFDFALDPYISKSSIIGRKEAFYSVSFSSILGLLDQRIISFSRGSTSRKNLFNIVKEHRKNSKYKRILFYPEGTRKNYKKLLSANDIKNKLKLGLLKSIYECSENLPIQLCLSSNKEYVFNQKKFSCIYGMKVNTEFSNAIYPSDFKTFENFIDKITNEWYKIWSNLN